VCGTGGDVPVSHTAGLSGKCGQPRVHCWLACPLQVQMMALVPGLVPRPLASRQNVVPPTVTVSWPEEVCVQVWFVPPLQHDTDRDAQPDPATRLKRIREEHPDIKIIVRNPCEALIPEPDGQRFIVRWSLGELLDEVEKRLAARAANPAGRPT
jgi:hypothetical protein